MFMLCLCLLVSIFILIPIVGTHCCCQKRAGHSVLRLVAGTLGRMSKDCCAGTRCARRRRDAHYEAFFLRATAFRIVCRPTSQIRMLLECHRHVVGTHSKRQSPNARNAGACGKKSRSYDGAGHSRGGLGWRFWGSLHQARNPPSELLITCIAAPEHPHSAAECFSIIAISIL